MKTVKHQSRLKRFLVTNLVAHTLLALPVLVVPIVGYCDSDNGGLSNFFSNLVESKGKNMKDVAVQVAEFKVHDQIDVRGLDFSPDGKQLAAVSSYKNIHIWDWKNGRVVQTLEKKGYGSTGVTDGETTDSIRYSPDGQFLAACHDRAPDAVVGRIWNTANWAIVQDIVDSGGGGCSAVGFTTDGKSLIRLQTRSLQQANQDTVIVYDVNTWQRVWGLQTFPFHPRALAVSPDEKYVAIAGNISNPQWASPTPLPGFGTPPFPDQGLIAIVDLAQRRIVHTIKAMDETDTIPRRLAWNPDGKSVAMAGMNGVRVFDVQSGQMLADEPREASISHHMFIRYSTDGKYLLEGTSTGLVPGWAVRIWDSQHRELLQTIEGDARSLAVSRDGHYFAVGTQDRIVVWQLK